MAYTGQAELARIIDRNFAEAKRLANQLADANEQCVAAMARADKAEAENVMLREALSYPRFGNTAGLLYHAAEFIDKQTPDGWDSIISPHLRRAAECIETALGVDKGEAK